MYSQNLRAIKRLIFDTTGAALVEFSIVFPIFASVAFGAVDLANVLYRWNAIAKATHLGARAAVVQDPVANGLKNLTAQYWSVEGAGYYENIGLSCQNAATGAAIAANCPTIVVNCVVATGTSGTCTATNGNAHAFNNAAFTCDPPPAGRQPCIFEAMKKALPALRREHVRISYRTTGLGFAGRPNLPMEVSVSIQCMTQDLFFAGLYNLVTPAAPAGCPGATSGWRIPASTATITGEDFDAVDAEVPTAAK